MRDTRCTDRAFSAAPREARKCLIPYASRMPTDHVSNDAALLGTCRDDARMPQLAPLGPPTRRDNLDLLAERIAGMQPLDAAAAARPPGQQNPGPQPESSSPARPPSRGC